MDDRPIWTVHLTRFYNPTRSAIKRAVIRLRNQSRRPHTARREPAVTEELVLILMAGIALGGISWTVWDIRSDLRRRKLK